LSSCPKSAIVYICRSDEFSNIYLCILLADQKFRIRKNKLFRPKLILVLIALLTLRFNSAYGETKDCPIDSLYSLVSTYNGMDLKHALDSANVNYEELLETHSPSCIINLYTQYVINNGEKGIYYLVFNDLWDALLLADQFNLNKEKYFINKDIGRFYGYLNKYEKAHAYFDEAEKYLEYIEHDSVNILNFYSLKSQLYTESGELDKAKLYLDTCYQILEKVYMEHQFEFLEHRRASILQDEEKHEEAIPIFKTVITNFKESKPSFLGIVNYDLGYSYFKIGNYRKSLEALTRAIQIIEKYERHVGHLPEAYGRLSQVYYLLGNYEMAYKMSSKANDLKTTIFDTRIGVNSQLLEINDAFKEYKEQEEKRIKEIELKKLTQDRKLLIFQRLLLALSIIFLGLIAFLYIRFQRQRIKSEKELNSKLTSQNEEIQKLLKKIETKNEELKVFSNIMSHDLKAPLRSINSFSGLIEMTIKANGDLNKISDYNKFITSSSKSMTQLIEDLLNFSKIGLKEYQFSRVNLEELIDETLKAFSFDISSGKSSIKIETLPEVNGSRELLKTVFHNLISNAIKYQAKTDEPHTSQIVIWSEIEKHENHIFIKENGIGIAPEFQEKLFDAFTRYHNSSEYSGTGLGLSMCREIMLKHKGGIKLLSSSVGETIFKLTFPII